MNLLLHCGAKEATWDQLKQVETPEPTKTHCPIPHHNLYEMVTKVLEGFDFKITESQHGLTKDGNRYFGLLQLESDHLKDWKPVCGLRNSHDKSISAGLVFGLSVMVCDNLSFYGDLFQFDRKHTAHINKDLIERVTEVVAKTEQQNARMEHVVNHYKSVKCSDRKAHHIVVKALDAGATLPRRVPQVLEEWRKPRHEEFEPRNAWSLFNAFTESMKSAGDIGTHVNRTNRLHRVFDTELKTDRYIEEVLLPKSKEPIEEVPKKNIWGKIGSLFQNN